MSKLLNYRICSTKVLIFIRRCVCCERVKNVAIPNVTLAGAISSFTQKESQLKQTQSMEGTYPGSDNLSRKVYRLCHLIQTLRITVQHIVSNIPLQ